MDVSASLLLKFNRRMRLHTTRKESCSIRKMSITMGFSLVSFTSIYAVAKVEEIISLMRIPWALTRLAINSLLESSIFPMDDQASLSYLILGLLCF